MSGGSLIENPFSGLLLAKWGWQTDDLSDFYPISICGGSEPSAEGNSRSGGLIIRWSLVRVQPAPRSKVLVTSAWSTTKIGERVDPRLTSARRPTLSGMKGVKGILSSGQRCWRV
jgi:hypothetical protein